VCRKPGGLPQEFVRKILPRERTRPPPVLDDPYPVIQRERDVHRWCPGSTAAHRHQEGQDALPPRTKGWEGKKGTFIAGILEHGTMSTNPARQGTPALTGRCNFDNPLS
jgi:hypothetical protein